MDEHFDGPPASSSPSNDGTPARVTERVVDALEPLLDPSENPFDLFLSEDSDTPEAPRADATPPGDGSMLVFVNDESSIAPSDGVFDQEAPAWPAWADAAAAAAAFRTRTVRDRAGRALSAASVSTVRRSSEAFVARAQAGVAAALRTLADVSFSTPSEALVALIGAGAIVGLGMLSGLVRDAVTPAPVTEFAAAARPIQPDVVAAKVVNADETPQRDERSERSAALTSPEPADRAELAASAGAAQPPSSRSWPAPEVASPRAPPATVRDSGQQVARVQLPASSRPLRASGAAAAPRPESLTPPIAQPRTDRAVSVSPSTALTPVAVVPITVPRETGTDVTGSSAGALPPSFTPAPAAAEAPVRPDTRADDRSPAAVLPVAGAPVSAAAPARPQSAAVQQVLDRYRDALNALDAAAAGAVWPSADTRALGRAFSRLEQQVLQFDSCRIAVYGQRAVASCPGTLRYVPKVGGQDFRVEQRQWEFDLRSVDDNWAIDRVTAR
jgi:hypothetical protein